REPVADVPGRIDGAIEDLDMVLARFTALLRISEIEVSGRRSGFAGVDLMTLIAQVGELYEPLADERDVTLSMHGSYGHVVECDEGLMLEGLSNLVDNALKFTEPGGEVSLAVLVRPEGVAIEVRDNGPGIAPAERSLVLRRFYRGAASRTVAGTGLGLNLVAAIAHLHGFALELDDAAPGLIVRVVCYEAA
ncbi:MAG TPA: HAMP domain-containing sensor histidine kinase, partial [Novosphingobium sp.]|nr:HAMP domain-containing sensor histidine kinase [Novosphingobium sp.]